MQTRQIQDGQYTATVYTLIREGRLRRRGRNTKQRASTIPKVQSSPFIARVLLLQSSRL